MAKYDLISGVQQAPVKLFAYGPEGIGKSTFAAQMPEPIFIDVEGGTNQLPVTRMPQPTSWEIFMDEIASVLQDNIPCSSLVIDTVDAAQTLAIRSACAEHDVKGIEDFGWGKGYVYVYEHWCKMLDLLDRVYASGRNIVLLGHSRIDRTERPDADGGYDRFVPNLNNGRRSDISGVTKSWCDMVLFFDYKTIVETESDRKGNVIKAKAKGGRRIVHTEHHPCWDAKNRYGLPSEMPLNDETVQRVCSLMCRVPSAPALEPTPKAPQATNPTMQAVDEQIGRMEQDLERISAISKGSEPDPRPKPQTQAEAEPDPRDSYPAEFRPLVDLMRADGISDHELRQAVGAKGYFPYECPVDQYPAEFVQWLTSVWANFVGFVKEQRQLQA